MGIQNYSSDQMKTLASKRKGTRSQMSWITVGVLLGLCCLLVLGGAAAYYFLFPSGGERTLVLIHAPQNGENLELGKLTTVRAIASDENKITRIELWIDGQLHESESSSVPGGLSSFPLLVDWQPPVSGRHTLTVRAFNSRGVRTHASINVDVIEAADRDSDGVDDLLDTCPDQQGLDIAEGCPDHDRDGIPDASDACLDVAGLLEAGGCPMGSEGDRDGDGTPDATDICPNEPGSPLAEGCPDADGDLVADADDVCSGEPGWDDRDGCPTPGDSDGDGILDGEDACPDEWGLPENGGCPEAPGIPETEGIPESDAGDRDGDGAPDDVDPCPGEAGRAEDDFCPPPEDDPALPDAGPFFEFPGFFFGVVVIPTPVEFEALHFEVPLEYRRVWCYARLAEGDVERYEFEPGGEREWNIVEVLGGGNSVHLGVPANQPLEVFAECYGVTSIFAPRTYYLGSITRAHVAEEWDGHVIEAESTGGEVGGHSFRVRYHLCSPSCRETALQPPVITRVSSDGDQVRLYWDWEGDIRTIEGFKLYLNGNFIQEIPREEREIRWRRSGLYCVDVWQFYLTTFDGPDPLTPDLESSPSNSVDWEGEPCQKSIRITFETLQMHNPPNDREGSNSAGPLWGNFTVAAGGNIATLRFDAERCYRFPVPPFEDCFGLRLGAGDHSIQGILDWIHNQIDNCRPGIVCHARRYSASTTDTTIIEVNPGDDLTLSARINDVDERDDDDVLFNGRTTVNVSELSPDSVLLVPIHGDHLDVIVLVDLFPFEP